MFKKTIVLALIVVVLAFCPSYSRAADMTYNIVDYPSYESDIITGGTDTISGTIITDGNFGSLTQADIVGATWTFTNPQLGSFTRTVNGDDIQIMMAGTLTATATQLILPQPTGSNYEMFVLNFNDLPTYPPYPLGFQAAEIDWQLDPPDHPVGNYFDFFDGGVIVITDPNNSPWSALFQNVMPIPSALGGNYNWVIATVPEPGGAYAPGVGAAGTGRGILYAAASEGLTNASPSQPKPRPEPPSPLPTQHQRRTKSPMRRASAPCS